MTTSAAAPLHVLPLDAFRVSSRPPEDRTPSSGDHEVRNPVTGAEGWIRPLQHQHIPRRHVVECDGQALEPLTEATDQIPCCSADAEDLADRGDRLDDVVEAVRIEGDDLGRASEVREGFVDPRHVDGAHGAQVLREHQIGVEVRQGLRVEAIEVFTGGHPRRDHGVDLRRRQSFGECRRGDHPARSCLPRMVAFERDPDEILASAEREHDLGCRREEGDHAHGVIVESEPACKCPATRRGGSWLTGTISSSRIR